MKKVIELIEEELKSAFKANGYDEGFARATISNRPDLCEYQCNGAMALAKQLHKAPIEIATNIVNALSTDGESAISTAEAVNPGFINIRINEDFLADFLNELAESDRLGTSQIGAGKKLILDYGGPNVAKPLHIGHLRAAIIGQALKNIYRYNGYEVIGDVHLGDWGLQMGLIMEEIKNRGIQDSFTISDLEEIYPFASAKAKEDENYAALAHEATAKLQNGDAEYTEMFKKIIDISVNDLKKNYANLNVDFDIWKGESDAQKFIPPMLEAMREQGILRESEGAFVIDVAMDDDKKEIPPCLVIKSDGASLYATTDLATLVDRMQTYNPDGILYVVDKRQSMHFVQVFRAARKAGIVGDDTWLYHLGFGTMNGKDGKPFKTREGGVMRLERLIADTNEAVYNKMVANATDLPEAEARQTARLVAMSAIKYGDLSNQATKDYIFDLDKFTSFEGNTGPYILYTIVRIRSILRKYYEAQAGESRVEAQAGETRVEAQVRESRILKAESDAEKSLQLILTRAFEVIEEAAIDKAPHRICQYIYEVSNAFNSFYHETKILAEADENKKAGYIALLKLTEHVLSECIHLLGFDAPERM